MATDEELAAAEEWAAPGVLGHWCAWCGGTVSDTCCSERIDYLETQQLRADLSRALPVVEAAGALVEHGVRITSNGTVRVDQGRYDALARAYRAAREPRTGEGT